MLVSKTLQTAYHAAYNNAIWIDRSTMGRVWATGQHRIDLIHRMSTNDLTDMAEGEGRATVLTNAVAKIIDRLIVINLGERALLLTSPGRATMLRGWLARYIFFNDDIKLTDAGDTLGQVDVYGPKAAEIVSRWLPDAAALPRYHARAVDDLIVVRADSLAGAGFHLIAPPETLATVTTALEAQGVAAGNGIASDDGAALFEVLRVEAGLPGPGGEITEDYIPLEASLWDDVNFSKGCYIGQEIIARMESRGRLAKTLVAVQAEAPLATGAKLRGPAGERGVLTSAIKSPMHGWLGLGFIKPVAAEPGTELRLNESEQIARVVTLPFSDR